MLWMPCRDQLTCRLSLIRIFYFVCLHTVAFFSPFLSTRPMSAMERTIGRRLASFFWFWWWCCFSSVSRTLFLSSSPSGENKSWWSKTMSEADTDRLFSSQLRATGTWLEHQYYRPRFKTSNRHKGHKVKSNFLLSAQSIPSYIQVKPVNSITCKMYLCVFVTCCCVVTSVTCDLFKGISPHVEKHGAVHDAASQLKQAVQRQSGYVGFTPSLPSVLHVLLELQPPVTGVWVAVRKEASRRQTCRPSVRAARTTLT